MKTKHIIWGLCALAMIWVGMNFSNKGPFHAPQTDAEKTLDATLQKINNDDYLLENAHIRPGGVPKSKRIDYSPLLSATLMQRLAVAEKQIVSQDCNDVYIDGAECGFDYNPILCAQDTNPTYIYQTTRAGADTATIDYSWPVSAGRKEEAIAHYGLVRDAGGWKIDTVQCVLD